MVPSWFHGYIWIYEHHSDIHCNYVSQGSNFLKPECGNVDTKPRDDTYLISISHTSQSTCLSGMLIDAYSQSFPLQLHVAIQVVKPPVSMSILILHTRYCPAISHDGFAVCLTLTDTCELEQTRRRPVIITENEALIASGTHCLMVSPGSQHS